MTTPFKWSAISNGWYFLEGQELNQAPGAATPAVNELFLVPFYGKRGWTLSEIGYEITTQGVSASGTDELRFGLFAPHASTGQADALVADYGKVDLEATIGVKAFNVADTPLEPQLYWLGAVRQTTGTIGVAGQVRTLTPAPWVRHMFPETGATSTFGTSNILGKYGYVVSGVSGALPANVTPLVGGIGVATTWMQIRLL